MPVKLVSLLLTLHFLPFNLFAQSITKNQEVQLLLDKPSKIYKNISANSGIGTLSLCAMAAAAATVEQMPKRTLDEATNKVLEIMRYLQRNNAVYEANPTLNRKLSEAFLELRHKYTYGYMRAPLQNQQLPSMITNDFVFVLDNLKYPKGNNKLKELVKEFNAILGRKKTSASVTGTALLVVGGILALTLIPQNSDAVQISNKRLLYTRALERAKESSPKAFALTALELGQENKKLTAEIISSNNIYYPLFKQEITAITNQETVRKVSDALIDTKEINSKTTELKKLFTSGDMDALRNKYILNF